MNKRITRKDVAGYAPTHGLRALFTATLALAITFTFNGCSNGNDDEGGGGGGISDLPTQLYFAEYDYEKWQYVFSESNDNADITLYLWDDANDSGDSLPAGKIQNGKIAWNMPNSIDKKYLRKMDAPCEDDPNYPNPPGYVCKDKLNYTKDIYIGDVRFYFNTPEKGKCRLRLMAESAIVDFIYFSKSGKITGTIEQTSRWGGCSNDECEYELGPTVTYTYDVNFSAGWDVMYRVETGENKVTASTNKSVLKGEEPKWVVDYCSNDDY